MEITTSLYDLFEALLDSVEEEFPEWETREQDEFAREVLADLALNGKISFGDLPAGKYPRIRPLLPESLAVSG